jgi:hypothetical protein
MSLDPAKCQRYIALTIVARRHFEGLSAETLRAQLPVEVLLRVGRRWFVDEDGFTAWLESRRLDPRQTSLRDDFLRRAVRPTGSLRPEFANLVRGSSAGSAGGSSGP